MSGDRLAVAQLRPGSAMSGIYWAVRNAPRGLARSAINAEFRVMAPKTIENCLTRLMAARLIAQPLGRGTPYLVDDSCGAQLDDIDVLAAQGTLALDLVTDCDAGMAVQLLSDELGLFASEVHVALRPALASGQVELVCLEARHGGLAYRPNPHVLAQIAEAERARRVAAGAPSGLAVVMDVPCA